MNRRGHFGLGPITPGLILLLWPAWVVTQVWPDCLGGSEFAAIMAACTVWWLTILFAGAWLVGTAIGTLWAALFPPRNKEDGDGDRKRAGR